VPSSYTQIGKRLAYFVLNRTKLPYSQEIWTMPLEDRDGQLKAGQPERFSQLSGAAAEFSPDGRWLAYESSGQGAAFERGEGPLRGRGLRGGAAADRQVIVRPFPPPAEGQERQVQITNHGTLPRWSQTGQLFYQSGTQIMILSYMVNGNDFVAGKARVWT